MVRLLLIRHAATVASENKLLLGSTDAGASDPGLLELERLQPLLEPYGPESWYCSPMLRVSQTADRLQSLGVVKKRLHVDERLREIDFGRWEQKSFAEIQAADPGLLPGWSQYHDFVFPGGESVAGFIARVADVLKELRTSGEEQVAVITHGGVIRTMICLALGVSAKNYLLFNVDPGSLTILDVYSEGGVLSGLNL